ncbi:MAG: glycoside hydrolase family 32 protein [Chitinophagaceae bacterium]|nr:MAG: glycoside hydrolase family 32 protein [Chitinophagaceae bacterium]
MFPASSTFLLAFSFVVSTVSAQSNNYKSDKHRPQYHFSPNEHWMNDPNGMVYYNGTYHLFFQHYPEKTIWGPMHWGHATSRDLVNWTQQPIALYPDSLGWIFSGSAVIDYKNTSGFGKDNKPAMVAIFTHHNDSLEKLGGNNHQYQSLAYSNDEGRTWTKYEGNPVLKNPGIQDFRDPKVFWYEKGSKWIMTLATKDRITFYSSPDLKSWEKESDVGAEFGGHGGVWECPDLIEMKYGVTTKWVLLVSINPGGPNGGSVTQYFVGNFDGKTFTPDDTLTRWMDYGPDNYAGVTWSNTGSRQILIGWMSNWLYANKVPTERWRSAMTIPRQLSLERVNGKPALSQKPVGELSKLERKRSSLTAFTVNRKFELPSLIKKGLNKIVINTDNTKSFSFVLSNTREQKVMVGYDKEKDEFYIDRTYSGPKGFSDAFFSRAVAPRLAKTRMLTMTLFTDQASVELFADDGTTVMTAVYFPDEVFKNITIEGDGLKVRALTVVEY